MTFEQIYLRVAYTFGWEHDPRELRYTFPPPFPIALIMIVPIVGIIVTNPLHLLLETLQQLWLVASLYFTGAIFLLGLSISYFYLMQKDARTSLQTAIVECLQIDMYRSNCLFLKLKTGDDIEQWYAISVEQQSAIVLHEPMTITFSPATHWIHHLILKE